MITQGTMIRCLWGLLGATLLASAIFTLAPGLDLAASRLFSSGEGFPINDNKDVQAFRNIAWWLSIGLCLLSALMLALRGIRPSVPRRISARVWGFAFSLYLMAPVAMANLLLKAFWGRARPRSIEEFGGSKAFTPALDITDQCARNCSFVSGEASGIIATALILTLLIAPTMGRGRMLFLTIVWSIATVTSSLRIAMGGHFLSDVVFAVLFTGLIAGVLYLLFRIDREPPSLTPRNLLHDLRAPFRP